MGEWRIYVLLRGYTLILVPKKREQEEEETGHLHFDLGENFLCSNTTCFSSTAYSECLLDPHLELHILLLLSLLLVRCYVSTLPYCRQTLTPCVDLWPYLSCPTSASSQLGDLPVSLVGTPREGTIFTFQLFADWSWNLWGKDQEQIVERQPLLGASSGSGQT